MEINNLEEEFRAAVKYIHQLPTQGPYKPSVERKLRYYALYKQAMHGKCKVPMPPFYSITARTKWTVWNSLGDMSRQEAMEKYLAEFKKDYSKFASVAPSYRHDS